MNKNVSGGKDFMISSLRDKNLALEKENAVLKERLELAKETVHDLCDEVNEWSWEARGFNVYGE